MTNRRIELTGITIKFNAATKKIYYRSKFSITILSMTLIIAASALPGHLKERASHSIPEGFTKFSLDAPLPPCARWKDHMPASRDPVAYRLYIDARKVWRSKIAWQFTREEAMRILTDVKKSADLGDWGARALMSHFYLEGLGVLESNHVLDANPEKGVEIARMAAEAMQPWGLYDLGVAYENGYGGAHYDVELAWAYYLKAAQLGSPEAQMALARAYGEARRLDDEKKMQECAYQQGHGPAAVELGMTARIQKRYNDALNIYQNGIKFGDAICAATLWLLFDKGHWRNTGAEEINLLRELGVAADPERSFRYKTISENLAINPDLRLTKLDLVLPLPPSKLPSWLGIDAMIEAESNVPPTY